MLVGGVRLGDTIDIGFGTITYATGAATNGDSTPTVTVYENGTDMSLGPTVTNITTGQYYVSFAVSTGNGFEVGKRYMVFANATVGGITSHVCIGSFIVWTRGPDDFAFPTTSGRSIDVTATGEVGIDWANIGGPTTTVNLSGTTVKTATDVETDTQDIQGRLPASLVSGRIDASVGAMAANTVTASAIATDAIDADALKADAIAEIADGVWDEDKSGHTTAGSFGAQKTRFEQ